MPGLHVSLNDLAIVSRHHSCLSFKNISVTRLLGLSLSYKAEHFMSLKLLVPCRYMLSQKKQHSYPVVMGWLKCRLSFLHSVHRSCAFKAADPPFTILSMDQTSLQHNPRDGCTLTNICEPFDLLYIAT